MVKSPTEIDFTMGSRTRRPKEQKTGRSGAEEILACRQPCGDQQHCKQHQPEHDKFEIGFFHVFSLLAASPPSPASTAQALAALAGARS